MSFPSRDNLKTCKYVFQKMGKRPANVKKAFKTPKFTAKTKRQNKILQKEQKGGVKDEPALQLSPVSGKYL